MRKEDTLTIQLSKYLQLQYPDVVFHFDTSTGGTFSIGMAVRNKKINPKKGYPDLFIAQPKNGKAGLFLELKKAGTKLLKKNGELFADEHLHDQQAMLIKLSTVGYVAKFAVGFDEAKYLIDEYLK